MSTHGDLNPYRHYLHGYSPFVDEFGMAVPACRCGRELAIPGGGECADCLIARVQASPGPDVVPDSEPVRFGPVQVPAPEVTL